MLTTQAVNKKIITHQKAETLTDTNNLKLEQPISINTANSILMASALTSVIAIKYGKRQFKKLQYKFSLKAISSSRGKRKIKWPYILLIVVGVGLLILLLWPLIKVLAMMLLFVLIFY